MFEKELQDLGLNDKESAVYLALLSVDNDSVIDLAKKTNINRTTIYPILESLMAKGLVFESKIDKKIRFSAEGPERLATFVERQKVLFEEKSERVKDLIPKLKTVQRESGEKPIVKVYEGKQGALSAIEEIYNNNPIDGISYSIYSKDLLNEMFNEKEREKFFKLRKDIKKLKSKSIYVSSAGDAKADSMSQRVRLDEKKYPIHCDINVIGDEVRISNLKSNPTTVFIKNKDLAETLKSIINYLIDKK
jgi:sugar-specific transcriptional regulator TrmB